MCQGYWPLSTIKEKFGTEFGIGNSQEGMTIILGLKDMMIEISKKYEKNLSVMVHVQAIGVENPHTKSCRLYTP